MSWLTSHKQPSPFFGSGILTLNGCEDEAILSGFCLCSVPRHMDGQTEYGIHDFTLVHCI